MDWFIFAFIALLVFLLVSGVYLLTRYKRCPSDHILVVFGKVAKGLPARCTSPSASCGMPGLRYRWRMMV